MLILLLILALLPVNLFAQTPVWKGKTEKKADGVHVLNPAEPMLPLKQVTTKELWRIGDSEEPDDNQLFDTIADLSVDVFGRVYLCDGGQSRVSVFGPDGTFISLIGGKGEGRGEFINPVSVFLVNDELIGTMQAQPNRLELFDRNALPVETFHFADDDYEKFAFFKRGIGFLDTLIVQNDSRRFTSEGLEETPTIESFDRHGQRIARLFQYPPLVISMAEVVLTDQALPHPGYRWNTGANGLCYFADPTVYTVTVKRLNGVVTHTIEQPYASRKREGKYKQFLDDYFEAAKKVIPVRATAKISGHDPAIEAVFPLEDGRLWILTSRGVRDRPSGSLGVFDEFDTNGKFVRQISVLGEGDPQQDSYYIFGDCLYVVVGYQAALSELIAPWLPDTRGIYRMAVICYQIEGL